MHIATFDKSFFKDADRKAIAAYLDEHDKNDFVFTNLLADGPIQYYFGKHLQPVEHDKQWALGRYKGVLGRIAAPDIHIVFFDDPNTRYVDKSLFPLLVYESKWMVIGAPPLYPKTAMDAIVRYDARARFAIDIVGQRVLKAGDVSVYRISWDEMRAFMGKSFFLSMPTAHIDFGSGISDEFKLYGVRGVEPGQPYSWTYPRVIERTVLTRAGVQWRANGAPLYETALLLNLAPGSDYDITVRATSHIPEQRLGASLNGRELLPKTPLGEPMAPHELTFRIPKEALAATPLQTLLLSYDSATKTPLAIDADEHAWDVGVALMDLSVRPVP